MASSESAGRVGRPGTEARQAAARSAADIGAVGALEKAFHELRQIDALRRRKRRETRFHFRLEIDRYSHAALPEGPVSGRFLTFNIAQIAAKAVI